jgi:hypothetical protein
MIVVAAFYVVRERSTTEAGSVRRQSDAALLTPLWLVGVDLSVSETGRLYPTPDG